MRLNSQYSIAKPLLRDIEPRIRIVTNSEDYNRVIQFRHQHMKRYFPDILRPSHDPFDEKAVILYTEDSQGQVSSTARLVFDSEDGLPDEPVLSSHLSHSRSKGESLVELGRFINQDKEKTLVKSYYRAFYYLSRAMRVDQVVMVMRQRNINFHVKKIGAKLLCADTGVTFGSEYRFAVVSWQLQATKARFLKWLGEESQCLS